VLQVQFYLTNCGATQRREKRATVWYANEKRGWSWNQTLADVSGGVRPPLKAITKSAVVVSINTTLVGLDKRTGQELWRHKIFCNYLVTASPDSDVVYAVGCDDMVYEGRIVVRERPLVALDARTGCEMWRADLLPLSNDMRCEPSKPIVLSPGTHG
jgi:outer membrane protein assembly factor BamB